MTHYEVLGVPEGASAEEIKSAYRFQMREYHPDKFQQMPAWVRLEAEAKSKEINAAYVVLGTTDKRLEYDAALAWKRRPIVTPPPPSKEEPKHEQETPKQWETPKWEQAQYTPAPKIVKKSTVLIMCFLGLWVINIIAMIASDSSAVPKPVIAVSTECSNTDTTLPKCSTGGPADHSIDQRQIDWLITQAAPQRPPRKTIRHKAKDMQYMSCDSPLYPTPNGQWPHATKEALLVVPNNTEVEVLKTQGEWAYIVYGVQKGWVTCD